MKTIICRICSVCLLIATLCLAGCGGFMSEEALQIESVVPVVLGDGSIQMTITYVDDVKDPDVFVIPKGNTGDDGPVGNGIVKIETKHDDEKKQTELTIIYSDQENIPNQTIYIPDGVAIVGVEDVYDEVTGSHTLTFISGNPALYQFQPITIPRGEKGDKGNGIKDYRTEDYVKELESGEIETGVSFIFVLDDGTEQSIDIPNPKGILSLSGGEDKEQNLYKIDIVYTTGEKETVTFPRPADPNKWYSGANTNDLDDPFYGKDGDFFFDTAHQEIWLKENGSWKKIVAFESTYNVTFDLNDDEENRASMPKGATTIYTIPAGEYFTAHGYDIPIPTRKGYNFMGWYTKKLVNPVTMSPFTDLTPVCGNITLYAIWEKA